METIKKLYRWRRARKGVRAIGAAYKAGDFDNVSYGVLEKYGIADMGESSLGEPEFIFSHRLVPINKEKLDKANALARATKELKKKILHEGQASYAPFTTNDTEPPVMIIHIRLDRLMDLIDRTISQEKKSLLKQMLADAKASEDVNDRKWSRSDFIKWAEHEIGELE